MLPLENDVRAKQRARPDEATVTRNCTELTNNSKLKNTSRMYRLETNFFMFQKA